jgi:hypothetical protein
MHVERAHEHPDHDLRLRRVLVHEVGELRRQPLLDADHLLAGRDLLHVDHGAVGRGDDAVACRRLAFRVAPKPVEIGNRYRRGCGAERG